MQQLDPKAVWLFYLGGVFSFIFSILIFSFVFAGFAAMLSTLYGLNFWYGLILVPIILVLKFIWAKLTYVNYRYELRAGFQNKICKSVTLFISCFEGYNFVTSSENKGENII